MRIDKIKLDNKHSQLAKKLEQANTDPSYSKMQNDLAPLIADMIAQGLQLAEKQKED